MAGTYRRSANERLERGGVLPQRGDCQVELLSADSASWGSPPVNRAARSLFPQRPAKAYVLKRWIRGGLLRARKMGQRTVISAEEIKRFRNEYCLAQEAAQMLGISRSTLSRWEVQGRIVPVYGKRVTPQAGFWLYRRRDLQRLVEVAS